MLLEIDHTTSYRYAEPVRLGTHRLMVRPMEGHDVQIRSSTLEIEPAHRIRWMHDSFDNSIAMVDFTDAAKSFRVRSHVVVRQFNINPFDFVLEPYALEMPFHYAELEAPDLTPFLHVHHPEDADPVKQWVRPFLSTAGRARTMDFLVALNKSVPLFFQYQRRETPGVQTPSETLKLRAGSCRDFALLLMEAARSLGLAARYVSGYLCESGNARLDAASGATHAWTEIYLPGAGWKGFDPTCGVLAADHHVRVAVAREPKQATPIRGAYSGPATAFLGLDVVVNARVQEPSGQS